MQVRDVMNTSVRAVRPDTKVMEVASLMCLYRYHGLPVTEEDGTLVGFIAEKDLLHHLFPTFERLMEEGLGNVDLDMEMGRYSEVLDLYVSNLMTRNPIAVTPDMHVLRAT
ncbi:MAG: CBS domain-containing protein, partial [Chromatiaceae bacterium]|nr:CBS domain-containing protein [Chromatiaceae bacterium]